MTTLFVLKMNTMRSYNHYEMVIVTTTPTPFLRPPLGTQFSGLCALDRTQCAKSRDAARKSPFFVYAELTVCIYDVQF